MGGAGYGGKVVRLSPLIGFRGGPRWNGRGGRPAAGEPRAGAVVDKAGGGEWKAGVVQGRRAVEEDGQW